MVQATDRRQCPSLVHNQLRGSGISVVAQFPHRRVLGYGSHDGDQPKGVQVHSWSTSCR